MGWISDKTRTRFGRRIPYLFFGAIGCGLTFPLIWMVPDGISGNALFVWLLDLSILCFCFQTMYTIPHTALGDEMTPDVHEKTLVMEMRAWMGKAARLFGPWAFAITQLPRWNGDTMLGVRYMGIAYGLIIMVIGIIPALTLRERYFQFFRKQNRLSLLRSVGYTFGNGRF